MRIRSIVMLAVTAMVAFGALAEGSLTVKHDAPVCLSSLCGRTVLTTSVTGPSAPTSVRVYFRAGADDPEYYLEMMGDDAGNYMAVLPATLRETESVTYRIVAVAEDESTTSTEPVTVPATADCQLASLAGNQVSFAQNSIVGLTDRSQTGAPKGFSCAGLVKVVGVDQTMLPNSACEEVRLAKSDPCFVPVEPSDSAAFGFLPAAALVSAAVAGAVIIENNNDEPSEPVSPSRP